MSTYTTVAAGLLAVLKAYDNGAVFASDNAKIDDFTALDAQGRTEAAVVAQAAPSQFGDNLGQGRGTHGKRQQRHRLVVALYVKRLQDDDGATVAALHALADGVIGWLDTYPRLNNTSSVKRAEVVEASDVIISRDSPNALITLMVEVLTETAPVLVESPR